MASVMQMFRQEVGSRAAQDRRSPADKLARTQRSSRVQKRTASGEKKCTSCGTTSTPVWRWGGESKEVLLCNACSLRIRRAGSRPQAQQQQQQQQLLLQQRAAASVSTEAAQTKHSPGLASTDSGSPTSERVLAELPAVEAEALRQHLLHSVERYIDQEKARLLGPREVLTHPISWPALSPARLPPLAPAPAPAQFLGPVLDAVAASAPPPAFPFAQQAGFRLGPAQEAVRQEYGAIMGANPGGFMQSAAEPGLVRLQ